MRNVELENKKASTLTIKRYPIRRRGIRNKERRAARGR
jgi:hypothetical protein